MLKFALTVMVLFAAALLAACGPPQLDEEQAAALIQIAADQHKHAIDVPVGEVAYLQYPDPDPYDRAANTMKMAENLRDENGFIDFAPCSEIRSGFFRIRTNRQCLISLTDAGEIAFGTAPEVEIDPKTYYVDAQHWLRPTLATAEIVGITAITQNEPGAEVGFQWRWSYSEFGEATSGWSGVDTEALHAGRTLLSLAEEGWRIEEIDWYHPPES